MKQGNLHFRLLAMLIGVAALAAGRASAADADFNVSDGTWTNSANWINGFPSASAGAYVGYSTGSKIATCRINAGDACTSAFLYVSYAAGTTGAVIQSGGDLALSSANDYRIGNGAGSTGAVIQSGGTVSGYRTLAVGSGAGSVGTYSLSGNATNFCANTSLQVGYTAGATGFVFQSGGVFQSSAGTTYIGNSGYGEYDLSGGLFYSLNPVLVYNNSSGYGRLVITNSGTFVAGGTFNIGKYGTGDWQMNGGSATLSNGVVLGGAGAGSGQWEMNSGTVTVALTSASSTAVVGSGTQSHGQLLMNGGALNSVGTAANSFYIAFGNTSTGLFVLAGGVFSNACALGLTYTDSTFGNAVGEMRVTGGTWIQNYKVLVGYGSNNIGRLTLDGVTVTNSSYTYLAGKTNNAQGYMWVQNGARWQQAGDLRVPDVAVAALTVSNATVDVEPGVATIGQTAAFSSGLVSLYGTQRTFRVNVLTVNATGALTNHVAKYAGGLDITNGAANALTITTGGTATGRVHVVFEQNPAVTGMFWGVRWYGTNHIAALTALHTSVPPGLTWDDSQLNPFYQNKTSIYTNDVYTYVGINVTRLPTAGSTIFFH